VTRRDSKVLTWRQNKVFTFVRDYITERGYSPSIREIQEASGLASSSSVAYVLSCLETKGCIHRIAGRQAVAISGQVLVSQEELAALLTWTDSWEMRQDPGVQRLRKAAGLT